LKPCLITLLATATAPARAEAPQKLGVLVAASYLGNGVAGGVALSSGVRFAMGEHVALSAQLGYGVLSGPATTQDRWWMLPTIAWVLPADPVRVDVGVGLGLGASSGYDSFAGYLRAPFSPTWSFQLVPAALAHIMTMTSLGRRVDVFIRVEAVTLLLLDSNIGFRTLRGPVGPADAVCFDTGAGLQLRLQ
jgi:hypothetical protein